MISSRVAAVTVTAVLCLAAGPSPRGEDVSSLLRQKTQEFSDAGQRGDSAVLDRLLDSRVVFFNEGGDVATKKDMVSGATPPPKGVSVKLTVTDWNCQVHGTVAVASFIDEQVEDYHGQVVHAKFRSVETWLEEGTEWRMIGSETIAVQDDPAAVTLPATVLDEYVGAYEAGPDARFTFTRRGDELMASANAGPATAQKAELRDVFFTPGRARFRKIFQRDARGAVTGFVYRREGHDIVFRRV